MTNGFRDAVDRRLGGLTFPQADRARVLAAVQAQRSPARKRRRFGLALALLAALLAAAALALGLCCAARQVAAQTAGQPPMAHPAANAEAPQRLVVQAGKRAIKAEEAFRRRYPGVDLQFTCRAMSAEEAAQLLLSKDDRVDVLALCVDHTFAAFVQKGFAADLSASARLQSELQTMDPAIAALLVDGQGRMIAYPAELRIWSCGIHPGYWQMAFGDRPLPTHLDALLDAWIDWETELGSDYPDIAFAIDFDYALYCQKIITFYAQQNDSPDACPDLTAPALRNALGKLARVYALRQRSGQSPAPLTPAQEEGMASILRFRAWDEAMNEPSQTVALTPENCLYDLYRWDHQRVPLTFAAGDTPQTDGTLFVYVVNPYSRHKEADIGFIECASEMHSDPCLYYAIHPQCSEPYEQPGFQDHIADLLRQRDRLGEALKRVDDAELATVAQLTAMLDYYDRALQNQERDKWLISEETIREQRPLLQGLKLHTTSLLLGAPGGVAERMIAELCARYADGSLSLDALLNELNARLHMMRIENE